MTALSVSVNGAEAEPAADPDALTRAVRAALDTGFRAGGPVAAAEISLTLLPPADMARLNARYHGVEGPTDVLAFRLDAPALPDGPDPAATVLGDVYVCPAVAREAASELGIEPGEELARLAVHGVLHLLGHDHPEDAAREDSEMYRLQERVLAGLAAEA